MNLFKNKEDRAGLYLTVIFHLTVIIVLLLYSIDSTLKREESFVLDFSKQEEIERKEKEEIFKEDISRRLDEMIAAAQSNSAPIRNIAVDAGSTRLKDDRGTDAEQLYKDAERLAKEKEDALAADTTGEGIIKDMFLYELGNHEYCITYDLEDTLDAVGLTVDEINADKRLLCGLKKALSQYLKDTKNY